MTAQRLNVMRILWAALFSGTLMFLVVGYLVVSQRPEALEPEAQLLPILGISALGLAAGSVLLPPFILRAALKGLGLLITAQPSPGPTPSGRRLRGRRFAEPETARSKLMVSAQTSFILGMALAEGVALHGFVLWFLGFSLSTALPFFVVCWALMVSKFPKLSTFEHELETVYDADLI